MRLSVWDSFPRTQCCRLGDLRIFHSVFSMQAAEGNTRLSGLLCGGSLFDMGVYCINAARYMFRDGPAGVREGILRGMYRIRKGGSQGAARTQLLKSGAILREVLAAAEILESDWNVSADVWSVTSFTISSSVRPGTAPGRTLRTDL